MLKNVDREFKTLIKNYIFKTCLLAYLYSFIN